MAAASVPNVHLAVASAAAIVSFGGLSVMMQSHAFLSGCGIGFLPLLARKCVQCVAAFVYALVFSLIFFTN